MEHQTDLPASGTARALPPAPLDYDPALNGISGWLVVFVIARLLAAALSISPMINAFSLIGYTIYDGWLYASIVFTALVDIALSVLIVVFIFRRSILFRHLFLLQIALTVAFLIIFASSLGEFPYDVPNLISSAIGLFIWTTYTFVSKRVKNTFIYPQTQFERPEEPWLI